MNETKVRILDAAERLIAVHGLDVSLRTITAEAGVNLAAVNYHFQSKDALVEALVARRFDDLNAVRSEMLDALEARFPDGPLPLEGVLEAFLAPTLLIKQKAPTHHRQLMGRMYAMPDELVKRIFAGHMQPTVERFNAAFRRAVPGLSAQDAAWRMVIAIGGVVHMMSWSRILPQVSGGLMDTEDIEDVLRRQISFSAAGFRASGTGATAEGEKA